MCANGTEMRKEDATVGREPPRLVLIKGSERRTVVLDHFPFSIGRLKDRDLVIDDGRVSRQHAQLTREPDGVYLVNQSVKLGTFVNGERVSRRKLAPDDRIGFGI